MISTDRGRLIATKQLVALADSGGFTLPADLLTAVQAPARISALPLPDVDSYTATEAGVDLAADPTAERLTALAERLADVERSRQHRNSAQLALTAAHEHAVAVVGNTVADLYGTVSAALKQAHGEVLEDAERHASVLTGHDLSHRRAILTAPTKVRTAWLALEHLADRYRALHAARAKLNTAATRQPQHDGNGEFATLADPHALTGYKVGASRPLRVEQPDDTVDRMVWLVTTAKPGQPWLPTVDEQDARWTEVYSDAQTMRRNAQAFAQAVGARGPAPRPTAA